MKVFKYKFTKLITALIYAGIVISVIGFALNIYLIVTVGAGSDMNPTYHILQYVLMFFITVVLFTLLLSMLISSYYSIDGKTLKTSFGLIKSKYKIDDIDVIVLDRETNKLSVTFNDNNYIVIVVKEEWYNDFVEAIIKANPSIEFSIKSKDEDGKKK